MSDLFSDMVENVTQYHQLENVTTVMQRYNADAVDSGSTDAILNSLQRFNALQLALCQQEDSINTVRNLPLEAHLLISQLETFAKDTTVIIDQFNSIVESGYIQKLKSLCEDISNQINSVAGNLIFIKNLQMN